RAEEAKGRHGRKPVTPSLYSTATVSRCRSERVVELELGRRRTQPGHVEFVLAFDPDPRFDEIGGEDVSGGEEVVVLLEVVEGLVEGAGNGLDVLGFLGREFVEVLVDRLRRLDAVADAVQTGHELRGEGEVGV